MYVWLVLAGPLLLLFAATALTAVGLIYGSEGVAAIGALGVVASLILPRMTGAFEFGPGGFKGTIWTEFFDQVLRKADERGLTPSEAIEIAVAEIEAPGSPLSSVASDAARAYWSAITASVAAERVDEAVEHDAEVRRIVERTVERRREAGWRIRSEKSPGKPEAMQPNIDFELETDKGLMLIDILFMKLPGNTTQLRARELGQAKDRLGAVQAYLVVPNDAQIGVGERDGAILLRSADLARQLANI